MLRCHLVALFSFVLMIIAPLAVAASERDQQQAIAKATKGRRVDFVRIFYPSKATGSEQSYALFVPKSYDPAKKKPVVVFLHSWYDRFDDRQWLRVAEIPGTIQAQCEERGWVAIGPEAFGNSWYNDKGEQQVLESVDEVAKSVSIDTSRLVLIGRSMGGAGALTIAMHHPDRVVATVALAPITDYVEYSNGNPGLLLADGPSSVKTAFGGMPDDKAEVYRSMSAIHNIDKLSKVPVYLIHGDKDGVVNVEHSRRIVPLLKKAGGKVMYKEVKDQDHVMEMIEWYVPEYFEFIDKNIGQKAAARKMARPR